MNDCNVILKDMLSRLLGFLHLSGSPALLRPRCGCWSVLITELGGSGKGEVLQSFPGKDHALGQLKRAEHLAPSERLHA